MQAASPAVRERCHQLQGLERTSHSGRCPWHRMVSSCGLGEPSGPTDLGHQQMSRHVADTQRPPRFSSSASNQLDARCDRNRWLSHNTHSRVPLGRRARQEPRLLRCASGVKSMSDANSDTLFMSDASIAITPVLETGSPCVVLEAAQGSEDSIMFKDERFIDRQRVITPMALMAITFFVVSGGPMGAEAIITASGPAVGLIALVVFSFVYFLPMCFMMTELVTSLPAGGAFAYWVAHAFGPFWGFQTGYWSWVSTCIDCAIYSAMAVTGILGPNTSLKGSFLEFVLKATLAIVLSVPSFVSVRSVGSLSMALFIFVVLPYSVFTVWGGIVAENWNELLHARHVNVTSTSDDSPVRTEVSIDWTGLISLLLWNFAGMFDACVFVTDVQNPAITYRKVMMVTLIVAPAFYIFPLGVAAAVNKPAWSTWQEGSLTDVAQAIGGDPMSGWVMGVSFLGGIGMYLCGLFSSSFLASGMAENGLAPRSLQKRSEKHNTPQSAVFCSLAVVLVVVCLEFKEMVMLSNSLNAFGGVVVILAALRLRIKFSRLKRPTKLCGDLPVGFAGIALLGPFATYAFAAYNVFHDGTAGMLTILFIFAGFVHGYRMDFSEFQGTL